jgi:hypothetical protein
LRQRFHARPQPERPARPEDLLTAQELHGLALHNYYPLPPEALVWVTCPPRERKRGRDRRLVRLYADLLALAAEQPDRLRKFLERVLRGGRRQ